MRILYFSEELYSQFSSISKTPWCDGVGEARRVCVSEVKIHSAHLRFTSTATGRTFLRHHDKGGTKIDVEDCSGSDSNLGTDPDFVLPMARDRCYPSAIRRSAL